MWVLQISLVNYQSGLVSLIGILKFSYLRASTLSKIWNGRIVICRVLHLSSCWIDTLLPHRNTSHPSRRRQFNEYSWMNCVNMNGSGCRFKSQIKKVRFCMSCQIDIMFFPPTRRTTHAHLCLLIIIIGFSLRKVECD